MKFLQRVSFGDHFNQYNTPPPRLSANDGRYCHPRALEMKGIDDIFDHNPIIYKWVSQDRGGNPNPLSNSHIINEANGF